MNDVSTQIPIAEQFYSIQGEGPNAGRPAVFLRLAGCNLMCGGNHNASVEKQEDMTPSEDAEWVCDTIEVWRNADVKMSPKDLVDDWEERGWFENMIPGGVHLILTGGEPMLEPRQEQIIGIVAEILRRRKYLPPIEVETNGTLVPDEHLRPYIDLYNVSLKLSNSGMDEDVRLRDDALEFHANSDKSKFKFVVSREEDVDEILEIVEEWSIPDERISLMPAGATREQLKTTYPLTAELCKDRVWDFSPRLQVTTWDQATGV